MRSPVQSSCAAALLLTLIWPCAASAQDPAVRGMAVMCANCHGTDGRSVGAVPGLAGADRAFLIQQMQDFRSGKRPSTIMQQLARGFTDAQVEQIAAYFAAQKK